MTQFVRWFGLTLLAAMGTWTAWGQAVPTASQALQLSVFGGGSGVFTDVFGGHNLSLTAGANLAIRPFFGVTPSFEVRGMYPMSSGTIAGEKELLGGLKLSKNYGVLHPYAEMLAGRGEIDFQNGGYNNGTLIYKSTTSPVFSGGLGVAVDLTRHVGLQADYQYQFWIDFPPLPGMINPQVVTGSVVYRFDFNHHFRVGRPASTPALAPSR
jgi:hypothetical protein